MTSAEQILAFIGLYLITSVAVAFIASQMHGDLAPRRMTRTEWTLACLLWPLVVLGVLLV